MQDLEYDCIWVWCKVKVTGLSESKSTAISVWVYVCVSGHVCKCVHREVTGGARSDQVNIDPVALCAQTQSYI